MSLAREYFDLHQKYDQEYGQGQTILIMQVGAFFECYGLQDPTTGVITGSNIETFCRLCDFHMVPKQVIIDGKQIIMSGFGTHMIDKYLNKLQQAGMTIVVYVQDEQKSNTTRSLAGIYSPGTFFTSDTQTINNNVLCIWVHWHDNRSIFLKHLSRRDADAWIHVGMAHIDIYTGETHLFEYQENYMIRSPTCFDEMERYASIYRPTECIVIGNLPENTLREIAGYANLMPKTLHILSLQEEAQDKKETMALKCEKQTYQREVLQTFYPMESNSFSSFYQSFREHTLATQAFCYLLDFIYQHNPHLVKRVAEPIMEHIGDRLILANHSLKQLNLIDDGVNDSSKSKYSSVERLLNQCLTPMGHRRFAHLLLHPTTDVAILEREYNIIDHFIKKKIDTQSLLSLKDMGKWMRMLFLGEKKMTPKHVALLYSNLKTIQSLHINHLRDDPIWTQYVQLPETEVHCGTMIQFLEKTLRLDLCLTVEDFDTNIFMPHVDSILDTHEEKWRLVNDQLETCRVYCIRLLQEKEKSKTAPSVKLYETEKNQVCLVATKNRCEQIRRAFEKAHTHPHDSDPTTSRLLENMTIILQNGNNCSIQSEALQQLYKEYTLLKTEMRQLLMQIYIDHVLKTLETHYDKLQSIIEYVTILDVVYTKAAVAKKYKYCRPLLEKSTGSGSFVRATDLRHALIEQLQQDQIYITNAVDLSETKGILLYGTNAVGKTSLIRALGIAVVLAQAGMFVPCTSFHLSPYKSLFTRILGNDNLFQGLSSFAVEMSELRTILKRADHCSLVLGDELCSGTESISAQSIFVAGIQSLAKRGTSFLFATHLHEIAVYEEIVVLTQEDKLRLMHMEVLFDPANDRLVYDRKLKDGVGSNMYGLEVCKSLHLPPDFLASANAIRMKYHPISHSLLERKPSHFNANKMMTVCEDCGQRMGEEMHHLTPQAEADEDGWIRDKEGRVFHKNHPANLKALCQMCHRNTHAMGSP